jgi:hypothetical protein
MEFKVGELVWVASAFNNEKYCGPAAIILAAYEDLPKIFLHNEKANQVWLEEEDIGISRVYDILYEGQIEVAVSAEWLVQFDESIF